MAKKKRVRCNDVKRIADYYAAVASGMTRAAVAESLGLSPMGMYFWQKRMEERGLDLPKPLPPTSAGVGGSFVPQLTYAFDISALPPETPAPIKRGRGRPRLARV